MNSNNMQNSRQNNMPGKQPAGNKHRPENKDNLDSREGEEQETKGDDVTHNKKENKGGHLKNRGKDEGR